MTDVATDVLRALRLVGTVYFRADFRAPWGMQIQGGAYANFHLVEGGACVVTSDALDEPVQLGSGDVVMFPHGHAHALRAEPAMAAPPAEQVIGNPSGQTADGRPVFGGDGTPTTLICGHFEVARRPGHPLISTLPNVIVVRADEGRDPTWLRAALELAVGESGGDRVAVGAVVDRLAEVLLIHMVRAWLDSEPATGSFFGALRDPHVAQALGAIHEDPAADWTVERLAKIAGLSRAAFAERFRSQVQDTPMNYVLAWRMQRAAQMVEDPRRSMADVAEAVGYRSEFAFAKAFKRVFGQGPGAYRKAQAG